MGRRRESERRARKVDERRAFTIWGLLHPFQLAFRSALFGGTYTGLMLRSRDAGLVFAVGIGILQAVLWWPNGPASRAVAAWKGLDLPRLRDEDKARKESR